MINASAPSTFMFCCSLIIEYAIPSINIFPLDLVYGYGDTIAEYDYLVFARVGCNNSNWSKLLFLVEEFKKVGKNLKKINRELRKIIRDICLNQFTIIRIQSNDDKRLNRYAPLCFNLPRAFIHRTSNLKDIVNKYLKIYWIGYELYLLLYYLTLYIKPEVLDGDYTKYLKIPLHRSFDTRVIYDYYIKCYNEHVNAINSYRLDLKDNYTLTSLACCTNEFIKKLDEIERSNISPMDKIKSSLNGVKKIVLLVLPQLHMAKKPEGYISKRVDFQRQAMEAIRSLLSMICSNVKTYIIAFNWRNLLREKFKEYINRLCGDDKSIEICEKEKSQDNEELSLEKMVQEEVDRDTGLIILILGDYWKPGILKILSLKWRAKKKLSIIIPETCYVPCGIDDSTTARSVKAENVYKKLKSDRSIFLFSHRIYIKRLN